MKSQKMSQKHQPEPPAVFVRAIVTPRNLRWEMQELQLAIARRAFELFETRSCEHGHDWEDWFRAESELLRPVSISMQELADRISVRTNVLGFEEKDELRVSIEPHRILILGKKEASAIETEEGKGEYIDWVPDRILQFIDLATEVMPDSAVVELQAGQLKIELRKAERKVETIITAA